VSAVVIPFKGEWQGHIEPIPYEGRREAAAFHDARLIRAAKFQNDDWTARLLLAILETLDRKQLELVEFRLMGPNLKGESAVQALALVQLATGDKKHRENVRNHLGALAAREAE
jgi:hypothetical protein